METLDFDERNYQRAVDVVATYSKNRKLRNKMGLVLAIRDALNQATQDDDDSKRIRLTKENQRLKKKLGNRQPKLKEKIVKRLIGYLRSRVFYKGVADGKDDHREFRKQHLQATYAEEDLVYYIREGKER